MIEIGYLAACQTYYQKIVANVSIYNRHRRTKEYLEMEHFMGAYFLLAIGLLVALVAFIAEIALNAWIVSTSKHKRNKWRRKKRKTKNETKTERKRVHKQFFTHTVNSTHLQLVRHHFSRPYVSLWCNKMVARLMVATAVAVFATKPRIVHRIANCIAAYKIQYYSIITGNLRHNVYDDVCNWMFSNVRDCDRVNGVRNGSSSDCLFVDVVAHGNGFAHYDDDDDSTGDDTAIAFDVNSLGFRRCCHRRRRRHCRRRHRRRCHWRFHHLSPTNCDWHENAILIASMAADNRPSMSRPPKIKRKQTLCRTSGANWTSSAAYYLMAKTTDFKSPVHPHSQHSQQSSMSFKSFQFSFIVIATFRKMGEWVSTKKYR